MFLKRFGTKLFIFKLSIQMSIQLLHWSSNLLVNDKLWYGFINKNRIINYFFNGTAYPNLPYGNPMEMSETSESVCCLTLFLFIC